MKRFGVSTGVLLLVVASAAIAGGGSPAVVPPAPSTPSVVSAAPTQLLSSAFSEPVVNSDFPDPFVLKSTGAYFAFSTNSGGRNVPVETSTNLVDWQALPDALPVPPEWMDAARPEFWAPEAIQVKGGYALYYAGRTSKTGLMCISVATSLKPQGPYRDSRDAPLICPEDQGGAIDPSPFIDKDGQRYLYWKNDGNCCGMATWIWVQKLSPEGTSLVGERKQLFYNDKVWESNVIEAPNTVLRDGRYYLFYSSGRWDSPFYAVGYAVANLPMGPFRKVSVDSPWLETMTGPVAGAGGQGITTDGAGKSWFYYHGWEESNTTYPSGRRAMYLSPIDWVGGRAVVGFTAARQGAPTPLKAK